MITRGCAEFRAAAAHPAPRNNLTSARAGSRPGAAAAEPFAPRQLDLSDVGSLPGLRHVPRSAMYRSSACVRLASSVTPSWNSRARKLAASRPSAERFRRLSEAGVLENPFDHHHVVGGQIVLVGARRHISLPCRSGMPFENASTFRPCPARCRSPAGEKGRPRTPQIMIDPPFRPE